MTVCLPEHFHPKTSSVWVTQSGKKGDRSFEKELDEYGVAALQAVAGAGAWGPYSRRNALRMWGEACKAERLRKPYPRPYDLRHSYITELLEGGASPEEVRLNTGHASVQQIIETYGTAAHKAIRKRVAAGFGARIVAQLGAAKAKQKSTHPIADVVLFAGAEEATNGARGANGGGAMKHPSPTDRIVKVRAYLTDLEFGYEHWRATQFMSPADAKLNHPGFVGEPLV